jgi:fimbrial chaperone protein
MRKYLSAALTAAFLTLPTTSAGAASLQVSPVSVEIPAPGASAILKLRNDGTAALNAQIRVFRWTQVNGEEKLEPTEDLVASPPIVSLAPKSDYTVRLVRVTKRPIEKGETYRLLVDELPDAKQQRNGAVTIVLRYSIPVFFYSLDAAEAKLAWSIEQRSGRMFVTATNNGDRHVRISALKLRTGDGTTISFGNGLTGYVLGRSIMRWSASNSALSKTSGIAAVGSIVISAQGDHGPISATASMQPAR